MTLIRNIYARGFKSFAYPTEMVFSEGFNCVIGPNGAGKSNIVDTVCFVLGKSSAKGMRAEKSANLIYNGGKKGKPAKEAEASIEFDNKEAKFPIQSDKVSITRTVRENGTSIYKINGEVRTRQQVLDLLNAAKINPDGHNIILQGDIVNFITMKPVERREVIEEISGIAVYEDKKNKCVGELNKVEEKLRETDIILAEREANLRELKKDRDQAKRFKELQAELVSDKGTIIHLQKKEKEDKLNETLSSIKESESRISKTREEISELKNQADSIKKEITEINVSIEEKGEKEQLILRQEIDELKEETIKASSRMDTISSELERVEQRKKQLKENAEAINAKIKALSEEKAIMEKQAESKKKEVEGIEAEISRIRKSHGMAGDSALEKLEAEISQAEAELANLASARQELILEKEKAAFRLSDINEKVQRLSSLGGMEEFKKKKKEIEQAAGQLAGAEEKEKTYVERLAQLRAEYNESTQELSQLLARQSGMKERISGDLAVRKVIELNKKGIYGTVAQLGEAEKIYALALEIAAGSKMQSIVVDTDATAKNCVDYLKKHKLGTASFLPLNKIKSREISPEAINMAKKAHGFALELIHYDRKYKSAFSYVFGSTIIVDDLESARKLGIGKARMVTLDGDVADFSGAITGGYRSAIRGAGFKEREIDAGILKLQKKITEIKKSVDSTESMKTENEDMTAQLKTRKADIEAEIIKIEAGLGVINLSELMDNKKRLESGLEASSKKVSELDKEISKLAKRISSLKEEGRKIRNDINKSGIMTKLDMIEPVKLKLKESIAELNAGLKNISTQINDMLNPELERTAQIIKQHDKEMESFRAEMKTLAELLKNRTAELKEKQNLEKKYYSKLKDMVDRRNKLNEKAQSREMSIIKAEERMRSIEQKMNSFSIEKARLTAETEALQKEFEALGELTIRKGILLDDLKIRVKEAEKELAKMGNINMRALEVYEEIHEEYAKLVEKLAKLKSEKNDVVLMMNEIESKKKSVFMKTFNTVSSSFSDIFSQLSTKGTAHAILENQENPFEGGVEIHVRIAGNKYLDLKSLSGGEKTLASLAFIFALQEYDPSPFYLLDEVDAALDKRNSELLSRFIAKYSKNAQYIVISHNDNVITEAEQIYGVSMQDGISKVVSLKI